LANNNTAILGNLGDFLPINFWGFSADKLLGIFTLKLEILEEFFLAWVGNPGTHRQIN
jgi:hypothetical protein